MRRIQQFLATLAAESHRHKDLREACTVALESLAEFDSQRSLDASESPLSLKELHAKLWKPFQLATSTPSLASKIKEIALDSIQKLIVHGELLGEEGGGGTRVLLQFSVSAVGGVRTTLASPKDSSIHGTFMSDETFEEIQEQPLLMIEIKRPSMEIVKCIGLAISSKTGPEEVLQLQAMKAVLALVTAPHCAVHARTLQEVVEICFDIAVYSPFTVARNTAKASLTQIVNAVMMRFAHHDHQTYVSLPLQSRANVNGMDHQAIALVAQDDDDHEHVKTMEVPVAAPAQPLVETDLDKYDLFLRPNVEVQSIHDLLLRDVLLVLHQMTRYLLEVPDAKASEETRGLTTQIGFEMILSMFKNGSNVASDPIITRYMRDELSNGIIAHTSTKDLLVFEYMTSLLHIALRDYRRGMDTQISRLLSEFIFPVLEEALNDLFAYRKKYFILQMISKLCENERFMLDLYEMYDQQPEQPNYFEHLLFTLSKLAQGKSSKKFTSTMGNLIGTHAAGLLLDSHADLELIQDERSRKRALRCLVLITTALKRLAQRELAQTSDKLPDDALSHIIQSAVARGEIGDSFHDISNHLMARDYSSSELGEFLSNPVNAPIFALYLQSKFDFGDVDFVDALRQYVAVVALPPRTDKADRLLMHFAQHYCLANKDVFASANSAYVLVYAAVLLNAELYCKKNALPFAKESFVRFCRECDHDTDLSDEFLGYVYEGVASEQLFTLDVTKVAYAPGHPCLGVTRALPPSTVVHMFGILWPALIATLSLTFEETVDTASEPTEMIQLCLSGFRMAVWIAGAYNLTTERDAFITSLARLSGLNHVHQMKPKNIAAIKTLLLIAMECGEYLSNSWTTIFDVVSQIERLNLIAMEANSPLTAASTLEKHARNRSISTPPIKFTDERPPIPRKGSFISTVFSHESEMPTSPSVNQATNFLNSLVSVGIHSAFQEGSRGAISLSELTKEFQAANIIEALDKMFTASPQLSRQAIVPFYEALAQVSLVELSAEPFRMYALQKIVEITYYNIHRNLFEWGMIWQALSGYFEQVGTHVDEQIAEYAIASLRQLTIQLLDRQELSEYETNRRVLMPFQHIMEATESPVLQELVLASLSHVCKSRVANIQSGWSTVFGVLANAGIKAHLPTVQAALELEQRIAEHHLALIDSASFADGVSSVLVFVAHPNQVAIVDDALMILSHYGAFLAQHHQETESAEQHFYTWFPMFSGLSQVAMAAASDEMRTRLLDGLYDLLRTFGSHFDLDFWTAIFKGILLGHFDALTDIVSIATDADMSTWMRTSQFIVDAYTHFYDTAFAHDTFILSQLLELIQHMLERRNEDLNQHALLLFTSLVEKNGTKLTPTQWGLVTQSATHLFQTITPNELAIHYEFTDGVKHYSRQATESLNFNAAVAKCTLQLFFIQHLDNLFRAQNTLVVLVPPQLRTPWMQCFHKSYTFARTFNQDKDLRAHIWKSGFVKQMPNLFKQEMVALTAYLRLAFSLYRTYGDASMSAHDLVGELRHLFVAYNDMLGDPGKHQRELANWTVTVVMAWEEVLTVPWTKVGEVKVVGFKRHLPELFQLAVSMLSSESKEVRTVLQEFLKQVGECFLNISG